MYTLVLTVSTDFHLEIYYSVRNTRTPLGNNLDFSETLLYDHLLQVVLFKSRDYCSVPFIFDL